jgi:hypothetical protein
LFFDTSQKEPRGGGLPAHSVAHGGLLGEDALDLAPMKFKSTSVVPGPDALLRRAATPRHNARAAVARPISRLIASAHGSTIS